MSGEREQRRTRARFAESKRVDRLPPHSPEAELGVLGCVMLDPKTCLAECVAAFQKGGGAVFYHDQNRLIYTTALEMWNGGEAVDVITLQQRLKDRDLLVQVGGIAYLAALPDTVPSAANLGYYLDIVREKYLLRSMLSTLTRSEQRVWEHSGDVAVLLDGIEASVLGVGEGAMSEEQDPIKVLVNKTIDRIEAIHRGVGLMGGLRTYFGYFDKMTGGLHRQEMVVLAGRPSTGKTSLAMNIVANLAMPPRREDAVPVGVFSMEMSAEDITFRLICAVAEVDFHKIRTGFIQETDFPKLTAAARRVSDAPIYIDDTPALDILTMRAKARRMAQQHGVKLIVGDYLQLMHSNNPRCKDRQGEVADISGGIKSMAKELGVPVLILSQLNREQAKNKWRKPQLEDLRESGAIEQDADVVVLLYRAKTDVEGNEVDEDADLDEMPVNALIAKQRNGPTGDVQLVFKRWCMKFVDAYGNRGALRPQREETEAETGTRGGRLPTNEELGLRQGGQG